jgi:hypothetical protein
VAKNLKKKNSTLPCVFGVLEMFFIDFHMRNRRKKATNLFFNLPIERENELIKNDLKMVEKQKLQKLLIFLFF